MDELDVSSEKSYEYPILDSTELRTFLSELFNEWINFKEEKKVIKEV